MATLKTPNKYHSAYSPIPFEVYYPTGNNKEYTLTISSNSNGKEQSQSLIRRIPGETVGPIGPQGPKGSGGSGEPLAPGASQSVTFDVSGVVRNLFGTEAPKMIEEVEVDNRLFVTYKCEGQTYVALNAVEFIPINEETLQHGEQLLSALPVFRKYEGYEFDISLLCGNKVEEFFTPNAVNRVKPRAIPIRHLQDKEGGFILDERGNYILVDGVTVVDTPVPRNPFYIRWINRRGGMDYWMFGKSQQISIAAKDAKTLIDYPTGYGNTFSVEVQNRVNVGASGISKKEWEVLSLLPLSPLIEWYDEKTYTWRTIVAAKSENSINTDRTMHDVEFTFDLPTLNTQFA